MNKQLVRKTGETLWHIVFIAIFCLIFFLSVYLLKNTRSLPHTIPLLDLILIIGAVFRLIRLFVYDEVVQFVRDASIDEKTVVKDHEEYYQKTLPKYGFKLALHNLITCPWCMGVWLSWAVVFVYFLSDYAWYAILILAIAGAASFIQIISNTIIALQKSINSK